MNQAARTQHQSVGAAVHDLCAARLLSLLGSAVRAAPAAGKGAEAAEASGAAAAGAADSLAQVSEVIAAAQRSKSASWARASSDEEAAVGATLLQATPAQPGVLQAAVFGLLALSALRVASRLSRLHLCCPAFIVILCKCFGQMVRHRRRPHGAPANMSQQMSLILNTRPGPGPGGQEAAAGVAPPAAAAGGVPGGGARLPGRRRRRRPGRHRRARLPARRQPPRDVRYRPPFCVGALMATAVSLHGWTIAAKTADVDKRSC